MMLEIQKLGVVLCILSDGLYHGYSLELHELSGEDRLERGLFQNYSKHARPVKNSTQTLQMQLDAQLYKILEVNERREYITLNIWHRTMWKDYRLQWNPEDFDGMEYSYFPSYKLWLPDLSVKGTLEVTPGMEFELAKIKVRFDGTIYWSRPLNLQIHCEFHVSDFPFDRQKCLFRHTSWLMPQSALDLDIMNAESAAKVYEDNSEWALVSYTGVFSEVHYTLVVDRKPQYYRMTIILPSILITVLSLIGILSPANQSGDRQEKVSMGLTTLLTMAVLLMVVTDQMPKTSDGFPAMGIFLMFQFMISSAASIVAVIIMYTHFACNGHPVPKFLKSLCCFCFSSNRNLDHNQPKDFKEPKKAKTEENVKLLSPKEIENGGKQHEMSAPIKEIHGIVEELTKLMAEVVIRRDDDEEEEKLWSSIFARVDFFFLLLFLGLNILGSTYFLSIR